LPAYLIKDHFIKQIEINVMAAIINLLKKRISIDRFFPPKPNLQPAEDMVFKAFFEALKNNEGLYVHIGTHHTYPFSKKIVRQQKGWQRIIIEPALGSKNLLSLFPWKDLKPDAEVDSSLHAHLNRDFGDDLEKKSGSKPGAIIKIINVRKTTLKEILDNYAPERQALIFLSIDAKGFDLALLKVGNWDKYFPLFIIVKTDTDLERVKAERIYNLLKRKKYVLFAKTMQASFLKLTGY
jgi:hypothetical protein